MPTMTGPTRAVEPLEGRTLFALTTFTIDPALSSLRLSGEVADVLDVEEQGNGSLTQNYEGAILADLDRKSTRLNSSHLVISYAVFCLKKKRKQLRRTE